MHAFLHDTAPAAAPPPTVPQQQQTRERLTTRWREQVTRVTDLSLRLHSLDDADPSSWPRSDAFAAELVIARRVLADIEAELGQLDPGVRAEANSRA
jgi:hypothetical protein